MSVSRPSRSTFGATGEASLSQASSELVGVSSVGTRIVSPVASAAVAAASAKAGWWNNARHPKSDRISILAAGELRGFRGTQVPPARRIPSASANAVMLLAL